VLLDEVNRNNSRSNVEVSTDRLSKPCLPWRGIFPTSNLRFSVEYRRINRISPSIHP
jgi:hypothetical protein